MINKLNTETLNIWGIWPQDKIIPYYFKNKASGHIPIIGIYDTILIGNNYNIDKFCLIFDNLYIYTHKQLPKCNYQKFDYLQPGYMKYIHLINEKINYESIELLGGILRKDGVKINFHLCPNNKKVCPVCKGSSVMIRETEISKVYKTCPFSDNKGYLTCDEYNLFLRGELKPKTTIFSKSN